MSDIQTAMTAIVTRLAGVVPVRTGRTALASSDRTLPSAVMWFASDRPAEGNGYARPVYTREITLEVQIAAGDDYPTELDSMLRQVRQALRPLVDGPVLPTALSLRETGARFFDPADNGDAAVLQISYEVDYLDRTLQEQSPWP